MRALTSDSRFAPEVPSMTRLLMAAIACGALLAGCATEPPAPPERLANTAWRLVELPGERVAEPQRSTLRFFDRQLAGGSLGCNAYSTTYFADATGLRFGAFAPTSETCAPPLMQQEARFLQALRTTRGVRVDDAGALVLLGEDGRVAARLVPIK
jgi:heat shock protein HslJ